MSPPEIASVVAALSDPDFADQRYDLIHILGLSFHKEYRDVVATYLDSPDDSMLARKALTVLCDWWGLADEYLPELESIARGMPWDWDEMARQTALFSLGDYLRDHPNRELLTLLMSTAEDDHEREVIRRDAVRGLAYSLGHRERDMPGVGEPLDSDWSISVLEGARRRL